jgi:hypothetical protein
MVFDALKRAKRLSQVSQIFNDIPGVLSPTTNLFLNRFSFNLNQHLITTANLKV